MRVIFVDDEIQVLKGIRRMLDRDDTPWDIEIAASGQEALDVMNEQPFDVLVSDMKMPGMDGAQLLNEVSRLYPDTVRIILSGQANKESVYRAVNPMHQYLAKPCKADDLRDTIKRAMALRTRLCNGKPQDFLGRISSLPSLPSLYQEVVNEIESEHGTLARVGKIISKDPAMTMKILQLANSAIFGVQTKVTSPEHAASLIGMDALKSLVLSLQVFKSFEGVELPSFSMSALLKHSLRVGEIAHLLCTREGFHKEMATEAFTAGLLHDVGKLILASHAPQDFASAIEASNSQAIALQAAERSIFGVAHDEVGGHLLALWGIPQSIVEAVTFHHSPSDASGSKLSVAMIVCIANVLSKEESGELSETQQQCRDDLIAELGSADRFNALRSLISNEGKSLDD
ncbi:MAG: HDOD domain-containing protein [Phycisphaera sp. RhM]|nr:HDOD domain-containing protein [Phycisphaera sp. RhM]